jgi:hypothetical protein
MIKLIPYKYRRKLSNWLLGVDSTLTEHKIVHYHPKSEEIVTQHQYDVREMKYHKEELHKQITRKIVTELVHEIIKNKMVRVEEITEMTPRGEIGKIIARIRVIKIEE